MSKKIGKLSCPMPEFDFDTITIGHGSGGQLTHQLLEKSIFRLFSNEQIDEQHDGAILHLSGRTAFSTDSFVVSPLFFPGGNIGDLAVNGTLNDLAMCGAIPRYLSLGLIIEEGLPIGELWRILCTIKVAAERQGVQVVTGDTKVVERGKGDKIFINTTGIGSISSEAKIGVGRIRNSDVVLVSGPVATHGMAILSVREGLEFETALKSDTQYVGDVACALLDKFGEHIRFMRDPTRGGLATVLNEIAQHMRLSLELEEDAIPVRSEAKNACEMLGLDPLFVANEGIFMLVVSEEHAGDVLQFLRQNTRCIDAASIGRVTDKFPGKVIVHSAYGGRRVVPMLIGEQLPRIC